MNTDTNLKNISDLYKNIGYFDQYGGSVILFIIITFTTIVLITYFYTMTNIQPIINDWPNQRCKPNIIPIAGLINKPSGMSISEFTSQNFTYCMQNILSNVSEEALKPLNFLTSNLQTVAGDTQNSIQDARGMMDNIRNAMQNVSQDVMGRLMNFTVPIMQMVISVKDVIGKIQGTMVAGLYTFLGSYLAMKSLMGVIAKIVITLLVALSAMIAGFWLFPFTWGAAIAGTTTFGLIAVPMAIILSFMSQTLHIDTSSYKIPQVKCFDKDTLIQMSNGTIKKIIDIDVGDKLLNNNIVTAKIKVATEGSQIYLLNNVFVSDSHIVFYKGHWIPVSKHPMAIKHKLYDEEFLYCLNTTNKIINVNGMTFTDWDELYEDTLVKVGVPHKNIHKYLDYGLKSGTKIAVNNVSFVNIENIKVNDILANGEKVYGIVKIDGSTVDAQFKYNLGENTFVDGCLVGEHTFERISLTEKQPILYNLLTDSGYFQVENTIIKDYNFAIDRFLG